MGYGPKQVFTCTGFASGTTTTATLDLGDKSYSKLCVQFPSMATAALLTVYGANSSTGTLRPVMERVNTAPVQHQNLTIATAVSGSWAMLDGIPFRYIALVASAAVADGGNSFTVMAMD